MFADDVRLWWEPGIWGGRMDIGGNLGGLSQLRALKPRTPSR